VIDLSALTGAALHGRPIVPNFRHLDIEVTDAVDPLTGTTDGILDSVIHIDANNSITVFDVSSLRASDFDFHV
jgi:hypothetical protein